MAFVFQKGFQASDQVEPINATLKAFDFLNQIDGVTTQITGEQYPTWNEAFKNLINPTMGPALLVGVPILLISRIVSTNLLERRKAGRRYLTLSQACLSGQPFIFQRGKPKVFGVVYALRRSQYERQSEAQEPTHPLIPPDSVWAFLAPY